MSGYTTRLKRDIARWNRAGLIDAATAAALRSDAEASHRGVSFATVLSMMAASLFCAAILLVVAANWEEIPRLARVGLLFACILGGYVGGAALRNAGRDGFAEGAWLLAATAFGASIALIAQMYHLSGDEKEAIFAWGAGTALAAAALRSAPLTIGAVLLALTWMVMHAGGDWWWSMREPPYAYLGVALALYILSFWTRAAPARHLLFLSLALFGLLDYARHEHIATPLLLMAGGAALFAAGRLRDLDADRFLGLGHGIQVHGLFLFLTGIVILQFAYEDESQFAFLSIAAFAGIVAALLICGRENGALRWLAYAGFVFQTVLVYLVLVGTMLGTAGFFLIGGLALSVLAWAIARIERRFSGPASEGGVS